MSLNAYYGAAFAPTEKTDPDYSPDKRVAFIRSLVGDRSGLDFAEIGSGNNLAMKQKLGVLFKSYIDAEPNSDCGTDLQSFDQIASTSADVVVSYFVLEHVSDTASFLRNCARVVRPDGVVIIEVPDLYLYGRDQAALRWWEHTNHFSPRTLARLAARSGLELVSISHSLCSRSFGFSAAFRTIDIPESGIETSDPIEVALGASFVDQGLESLEHYYSRLDRTRERIEAAKGRAVVWVANSIAVDLMAGLSPSAATFIDSDPKKRSFLPGVTVLTPGAAKASIENADLLVINSPTHARTIQDAFQKARGRPILPDKVIVMSVTV